MRDKIVASLTQMNQRGEHGRVDPMGEVWMPRRMTPATWHASCSASRRWPAGRARWTAWLVSSECPGVPCCGPFGA